MGERAHAVLLAEYNEWMNKKLYAAAARLPQQALTADRGAFFGSILSTLNHMLPVTRYGCGASKTMGPDLKRCGK